MVPIVQLMIYFNLRCENLPVCHPNSSQNESCVWLHLRDSIQFVQNPVQLHFNLKQLVCKYLKLKPYFRAFSLISLNCKKSQYPNLLVRVCVCEYIYLNIYTYIYRRLYAHKNRIPTSAHKRTRNTSNIHK